MRVRMKMDQTGTRTGVWGDGEYATREWPPRGSILDLPDEEAADYCRTGMAEPVAVFGQAETATIAEPELRTGTESGAALRRGRPRTQKTGA